MYVDVNYKLNAIYKDQFRSGIIASFPKMNSIVSCIDCSSRDSIKFAVDSFTKYTSRVRQDRWPVHTHCSYTVIKTLNRKQR